MRFALLCTMLVAMLLGACGGSERVRDDAPVLVFAASDLRDALAELAQRYRTEGGDSLVLVFGSTGDLTTQLLGGAPADLFFAANAQAIDDLSARGRVVDSTRAVYAIGRLAVLARCPASVRDTRPADCPRLELADLANDSIRTIAIADPSYAPYGRAARQALERAALWPSVSSRIVMGANVSQAEQFVSTGNADAGVVSLALLQRTPDRVYALVDASLHDPLRQTVAVMEGSVRADEAIAFLRFLGTPAARDIMERYGFTLPGSTSADDAPSGADSARAPSP